MFTQQYEEKLQSLRDQYIGRRVILTLTPYLKREIIQPNTGEPTTVILQGIEQSSYEATMTVSDVRWLELMEGFERVKLYFTDRSSLSMDLSHPLPVH